MQLAVISKERFNSVPLDIYKGDNAEFYMDREQAGTALEYTDPATAIGKLHIRHADRLDHFSFTNLVNGRPVYFYSLKGIMELCRWSRQPKADAFIDFVWDVMDRLIKGEHPANDYEQRLQRLEAMASIQPLPVIQDNINAFQNAIQQAICDGWKLLPIEDKGIDGEQVLGFYDDVCYYLISTAAYNLYRQYSGSPTTKRALGKELRAAGLSMVSPHQSQKGLTSFTKQAAGKSYFVMGIYKNRLILSL